ncbi:hypothetical protein [Streptomyces catenulae]|uniref:hypothetical protein n=1 Tax=Streptomyces catenulae TaxID=66875 RepID=UPI0004C1888E|nr:hypothetical protein [Streptomyces catenulae]
MDTAEVLLIGGRAGVGKTTVGWEVSAQLRAAAVRHCVIDGDYLGQAHPAPDGDPHRTALTTRNLAAVWSNYADRHAMGDGVRLVRVLLTATDATAGERLTAREIGSELTAELAGSARKARLLDARAPDDTVRLATDGRTVVDLAREVVGATGWAAPSAARSPGLPG